MDYENSFSTVLWSVSQASAFCRLDIAVGYIVRQVAIFLVFEVPSCGPPFTSDVMAFYRSVAIIYSRHTCALPVIQVKDNDHAKCKDY